jgi:outer membrane protein assembly factor BamB
LTARLLPPYCLANEGHPPRLRVADSEQLTMTDLAADLAPPAEPATPSSRPRLRVPLAGVGAFWAVVGVAYLFEFQTFNRFLIQFFLSLAVALVLLIWWSFNRRVPGRIRLLVIASAIGGLVAAQLLAHKSVGPFPFIYGLPLMFTAWALWLLLARGAGRRAWTAGMIVALVAPVAAFALVRAEGLLGNGLPDFAWRWNRSAEERYAQGGSAPAAPPTTAATSRPATVMLRPGDWPGFRGPRRDGVVRDALPPVATDWENAPPRQLWRRPIGAGWASVTIVDGRLFTIEQRGEQEAVVCLSADTGSEIWSHVEPGRFWDFLSAAGPRATPTFADGRIYAQGATGMLLCLDAATGQKIWSRDVLADSGGKLPEWGVCASPLVTDGVAVTFASGEGKKGLLAYRADTGAPAWSADAGMRSYSSPHLATIAGKPQVLFLGDRGLSAREPSSGAPLWSYEVPGQEPRSCQPMPVGDGQQVLVSRGMEVPTDLIDLKPGGADGAVTVAKRWTSRDLKPSFNDFVVHAGHAYGFDGRMFACVELAGGTRRWKKGRYGTGQVILLEALRLLVVLADDGRAVLVRANPDAFEELGSFQAINGKSWNHPAFAHGRLYVRNAEEIACYELVPGS